MVGWYDGWWIRHETERSGRGLLEDLPQHLYGETEEDY
jgi:hypothetical protein